MTGDAFLLGEEINNKTVRYKLHSGLWNRFVINNFDLQFENRDKIKYLNNNGDDFNPSINDIPNNVGGIYLFYIKCNIICGITEYPLYVGRAQNTNNQNLRKRVKEYFQHFAKNNERTKITLMFKYWSTELYVAYKVLDDNQNIIELEKQLINSLLFPMNDLIPDTDIKQAVKAFDI